MRKRKPRRIKRKKPLYAHRAFWVALLFVLAGGGLGYLFFFSPVFAIESVTVQGDSETLKLSIMELAPRGNLFRFNSSDLRNELEEKFPEIAELKVQRRIPNKVFITFERRFPVASWCKESQCLAVDSKGIAFESEEQGDLRVYVAFSPVAGEKVLEQELWQVLLDFRERAENLASFRESGLKFLSLEVVSETRVNWNTSENWEVYSNQKENLEWQLLKLQAVLEKQIPPAKRSDLSYIDLRFGDQAYIKY